MAKGLQGTCYYFFNNIYIKEILLHLDFLCWFWSQANQSSLMKEHIQDFACNILHGIVCEHRHNSVQEIWTQTLI